jgi:hypothetical protein
MIICAAALGGGRPHSRSAVLAGTLTPKFSWGIRASAEMMPMTVNGWPWMKMAGWSARPEIPSWLAAAAPMTATCCARDSWNWLNKVPAARVAPLAVRAPGVVAVTGRPSWLDPLAAGRALTAADLNVTFHHTPAAITP